MQNRLPSSGVSSDKTVETLDQLKDSAWKRLGDKAVWLEDAVNVIKAERKAFLEKLTMLIPDLEYHDFYRREELEPFLRTIKMIPYCLTPAGDEK